MQARPGGWEGKPMSRFWQLISKSHGAVVTVTVAFALVSCSDGTNDPAPRSTTISTRAAPPPSADAWQSNFDDDQLKAYRDALKRWEAFRVAIQPINAAGRATPEAKRILRDYIIPWQAYFKRLQTNEAAGIRIARSAEVLSSKATRIKLDDAGGSVTIRQCVDSTGMGATQDGEPLTSAYDGPQISDVTLSEVDERWLVTNTSDASEDRPCDS